MMEFDVSRFRFIYKERVFNGLAARMVFEDGEYPRLGEALKPKMLEVVAVNEDGNIVLLVDEAWMFQFVPIVQKGC